MVVYVDIVFLENVILDFIILLAVNIICNKEIRFIRILLASLLGGFYILFSLFFEKNIFILKIIVSILMILINFGFNNKKTFLKNLGVFYLTSITFGGSAFMFLSMTNSERLVYNKGHFTGLYPIKIAIIRGNIWLFINCSSDKKFKKKIFENV